MFFVSAVVTAAAILVEEVTHVMLAAFEVGVNTIVPADELPSALAGMVAEMAAVVALTDTALISGVAAQAGTAVSQPVITAVSWMQIATAFLIESRLDSADAAFDLDV